MREAAEESKRTSSLDFRVTLKLKGLSSQEKSSSESSAETPSVSGRGKMSLGTWYAVKGESSILT